MTDKKINSLTRKELIDEIETLIYNVDYAEDMIPRLLDRFYLVSKRTTEIEKSILEEAEFIRMGI